MKRSLGYFHHYIVTGWSSVQEKIIEYCVCFSNFCSSISSGPGEVIEKQISEDEIKKDIADGILYVIESPEYPHTDKEREEAKERFFKRLGEKAYRLACSNCEHLITYILTGQPYSEQIKEAGPWKMLLVDTFDNFISCGKSTIAKIFSCLLAVKPVSSFVKAATNEVLNAASQLTLNSTSQTATVCKRAINLCKYACKVSKYSESQLLGSTECTSIAKTASTEALKKTAATTFFMTGIVEACAATYEISNLKQRKEKGVLSERDYKREVTKTVTGAVCATTCTVAGGVIGQALCPMPVVGYCLGSFAGNVFGRWAGSVSSGLVFDKFW